MKDNYKGAAKTDGVFFDFGYNDFGPLILGFCKWLEYELNSKCIKKVYFLSRDGYFMKKIFDLVSNFEGETFYLYASRRLLQVASICDKNTYDIIVKTMYFPRKFKGEKLIKSWGDNTVLKNAPCELKKKVINRENILYEQEFRKYFEDNRDSIISNSKKEKRAFVDYLKKIKFEGKVAIVDIGWFGNMQNSIETMLGNCDITSEVFGYYLGVNPESEYYKKYNMAGFMFEPGKNEYFYKKEQFFENVLEVMFSAPHGSAIRYYYNEKDIEIELEESSYIASDSFAKVVDIQNGAYDYCKNKKNEFAHFIDEKFYTKNIYKDLRNPSMSIVNSIGTLQLDDGGQVSLINSKSFMYYLFHPKRLVNDFSESYWKVGFMKKVFKIGLPYSTILSLLKGIMA